MTPRFRNVEAPSEEAAREAGARELGVSPGDVAVEELGAGSFRVTVARAPAAIEVAVRKGGMEAVITSLTPPLGDGPAPTREMVERALAEIGVRAGLLTEVIDATVAAVAESGLERRDVVVARGHPPVRGTDAELTRAYLRPTEQDPERRRRVVRGGEVLIERRPPTLGEVGLTVTGESLPAAAGGDAQVLHGEGVVADEERLAWRVALPVFGYLETDEAGALRVVPPVTISEDGLRAHIDLRAPGADERPIQRGEVLAAIEAAGVVAGLSRERLSAAWSTFLRQGSLAEPALIAEGQPAVAGRDAGLEFVVEHTKLVGDLDEALGRVDFRERHMVHNVHAGQHLATWHHHATGTPGRGVDGRELPATPGKAERYTARENIVATEREDGSVVLESTIDGMLVVRGENELAVVELLEIPGDVDYQTGNVHASGCVVVRGSVRSEFQLEAADDVTVQGSIEAASVAVGGSLEVGGGILGDERARVSAGASLSVKFAQNAHITCGGDVEISDSDTGSVIECRGRLVAMGKHGHLRGGRYTALRGLVVRELGSDLGVPTVVSVGIDGALAGELRAVRQALREAGGGPGAETQALMERLRQLEAELLAGEAPTIEVKGTVHAGVDLYIRGAHLHVDESVAGVRFRYDPERRMVEMDAAA